ncbi:ATP-binding protein [Phreatobacter sp. AB_2022a]|uniref:ATP-binding protein n=1 Tax=Phreatobacter sp. AB_2022a TaxID=3003134 RepID=UPI0022876235|nr:ATP-binding protein [Phreatobacter sp. AB_2022a]MCZ0733523.1 ATP-binding protein [Phreatobacter sp. AB_2022a]
MKWLVDTIAGRTIVVLLVAMGVLHLASLWAYQSSIEQEVSLTNEALVADRLVTVARAVARAAPAERDATAHALSGGPLNAHWSTERQAIPITASSPFLAGLRARVLETAPDIGTDGVATGAHTAAESDPHVALVSIRLPDATWVNVNLVQVRPHNHFDSGHGTVLSTTLMAVGIVIVGILLVRWFTRPLATFTAAARTLYATAEPKLIAETGPREVRELAHAFNEMQDRIRKLVDDRTQTLAAVSHDLKTPITRLRFRIEDLPASRRRLIAADLTEMERMLEGTLAFLKGDRADEEVRSIDLASLVETIVDDLADQGAVVSYDGPRAVVIRGRRLALKRALSNLVDNAVKYGGCARVTLAVVGTAALATIDDDGPGIPADAVEDVFRPFVRLEASRNVETGGVGLGLTVARTILRGHGGDVTMANRGGGGLRVTVTLPLPAATIGNNQAIGA